MKFVSRDDFLDRLASISVSQPHGQRAPHKPLLLLLALGQLQNGDSRLTPYVYIDQKLEGLLTRFGPPRQKIHTEYPFGRLRNDRLWDIPDAEDISTTPKGDLHRSALIEQGAEGGLLESDYQMLASDPWLLQEAAQLLLYGHFPSTLHSDIRDAVGLREEWPVRDALRSRHGVREVRRRYRDKSFRPSVLSAYQHRCAVCNYDIRLAGEPLGLEAAHIRWHAAGGPDSVENGLALCGFHHKALDRGAWGLERQKGRFVILISRQVSGKGEAVRLLRTYHGKRLRSPNKDQPGPQPAFVDWHAREVFRIPALP